jgi:hypothetical protein
MNRPGGLGTGPTDDLLFGWSGYSDPSNSLVSSAGLINAEIYQPKSGASSAASNAMAVSPAVASSESDFPIALFFVGALALVIILGGND